MIVRWRVDDLVREPNIRWSKIHAVSADTPTVTLCRRAIGTRDTQRGAENIPSHARNDTRDVCKSCVKAVLKLIAYDTAKEKTNGEETRQV